MPGLINFSKATPLLSLRKTDLGRCDISALNAEEHCESFAKATLEQMPDEQQLLGQAPFFNS